MAAQSGRFLAIEVIFEKFAMVFRVICDAFAAIRQSPCF